MAMTAPQAAAVRARLEPIVQQAGAHLLASFERLPDHDVHRKGVVDLVTRLDIEAQALIVAGLHSAFPGEPIVAEEADAVAPIRDGPVWLVDPLDGTTNFVHGLPPFAVSVARARDGVVELGMIYAPYLRELFWGAAGCGAYLGPRRLAVSERDRLDDALLATGFAYDVRTNTSNNLREWAHMAVRARGLRRAGAAALDLAYVAAGRLDGFWEYRLRPWDVAAGALLVEEAGGRVLGLGPDPDWLWTGDVIAVNARLEAALAAALAAARGTEPPGGPACMA
jgi:myo-inositol-1(or 4)-monophosphatase